MIPYVKKKEMDSATDKAVLLDYIHTYAGYITAINTNRGTKAAENHLEELANQLSKRGILTQQEHEKLMYL